MAAPTLTLANQNWYRNNVATLANNAKSIAMAQTRQAINNNLGDVASVRNDTIDIVKNVSEVYGDRAKAISSQLFDYVMGMEGSNKVGGMWENEYDESWIQGKIRYLAQLIVDWDLEDYIDEVGDYASFLVWKSGFDNSWKNATKNGVRWARIPNGSKTCAFCYMLASRGFVYTSEEAAGGGFNAYHNLCDCAVIPSVDGNLKIEGYNREAIYKNYKKAYDNVYKGGMKGQELHNAILVELRKMFKESKEYI